MMYNISLSLFIGTVKLNSFKNTDIFTLLEFEMFQPNEVFWTVWTSAGSFPRFCHHF